MELLKEMYILKARAKKRDYLFDVVDGFCLGYFAAQYQLNTILEEDPETLRNLADDFDYDNNLGMNDTILETLRDLEVLPISKKKNGN